MFGLFVQISAWSWEEMKLCYFTKLLLFFEVLESCLSALFYINKYCGKFRYYKEACYPLSSKWHIGKLFNIYLFWLWQTSFNKY